MNLATRVQNIFTAAKLLAILIIVVGGVVKLAQGNTTHLAKGFEGSTSSFGDIATAFYSGLWAYDGWWVFGRGGAGQGGVGWREMGPGETSWGRMGWNRAGRGKVRWDGSGRGGVGFIKRVLLIVLT